MKTNIIKTVLLLIFTTCNIFVSHSQNSTKIQPNFWDNVQFGGGLGLNFSKEFTDITIAPGAIYNFNEFFSAGAGLQYSYVDFKNNYKSNVFGASILGLVNPLPEIQISAELEQIHASIHYGYLNEKDQFWNTNLFLGVGFRTNYVTAGVKYNVLHKKDRAVYSEAFMPFVRVYF